MRIGIDIDNTTKMNENIDSGDIERVSNWDEIYQKIKFLYILK